MKKNSIKLLFLIGIFFVAFAPWLLYFWADPDLSLTWSKGVFLTDELYHGGNSLKAALSESWRLTDYNYALMDPLMPVLQGLVYMIAGVSLISARFPAVFLNVCLAFLLVLFVYRHSPRKKLLSGLIALFLVASNYYFFIYGRLALTDLPMAALGWASFYCYYQALQSGGSRFTVKLLLSGVLLYLAVLMKASAANFILAYLIFIVLAVATKQLKKGWAKKSVVMVFLVAIAQITTLYILRVLSHTAHLTLRSDTLIRYKLPHGPGHVVYLYLTSFGNSFVVSNILPLMTTLFVLLMTLRNWRQRKLKMRTADLLIASLLISTFVFHGFFNYHPPRYYILLIIPIVWFLSTLPWRIENWGWNTERQINWLLIITILVVIAANGWNLVHYIAYLSYPHYSFRQTAQSVGRTIKKDLGQKEFNQAILYDENVHTSIPFYLALNFEYGRNFSEALQEGKKVYFISSKKQHGYKFLGSFQLFKRFKFYLYRIPDL